MKNQNKKRKRQLDWYMRTHFTAAIVLFFAVNVGTTLFVMLQQLPENTNFSGYYFYLLTSLATPLIVAALSYVIVPSQKDRLDKLFWTFVIATVAMLLFGAVQTLSWYVPFGVYSSVDGDSWILAEFVRTVIAFVPVLLYFGYLYWLQKYKLAK